MPTCLYDGCTKLARRRGLCLPHGKAFPDLNLNVSVDRSLRSTTKSHSELKLKYAEALKQLDLTEAKLAAFEAIRAATDHDLTIQPKHGSGTSEATAIIVASDWHVEERVGPEVGHLNRYSLEIAEARATTFFQSCQRLVQILQQDVKIDTVVLALLGDFITNDIHGAENAEVNALGPVDAILFAQRLIQAGIDFLLMHLPKTKLAIVCHSGNHGRTTQTTRFTTEHAHSLEYLLYTHLASYYRREPRVTVQVPAAPHSYVQIYGQTVRFHHGHMVKYGGGVGGLYIPVHKAINQWNKGRPADVDVFGHFHQLRDGGNFLCNGSLIGYNAFALSIKADYERPRQMLCLIDKKRGRTCTWPVWVEDRTSW